jgi:hypothetical protein
MSAVPKPPRTPEHYLELDRQAGFRSEYVNGEILAMAGASREHNLVVTNLVRELSTRLRSKPLVEHYTRQGDSLWTLAELVGLEAVLRLPSIGCELPLSDIYKRVEFTKITRMPLVGKSFAEASAK